MPPIYTENIILTGIHDFKTNISKYIRMLERGDYEQLILTSRGREIGGVYSFRGSELRKERARMADLSGLLNGSGGGLADPLDGAVDGWNGD